MTFEYRVRPHSMLMNAEREGLRRTVREHVYRKHHPLYAENLAEILLTGQTHLQEVSAEALALRAARDGLQREIGLIAADARALRESRDRLQSDIDLLAAAVEPERESLKAERDALRASLRSFQDDLARCRERIAEMEGTRAWRLRQTLARLKHRLRG